jgi:hypothetical protein
MKIGVLTSSRADYGIYLPLLNKLKERQGGQTTSEVLMLEKMEKCNCGRNFEVIYVCLKSEQECKDSKD